MDELPRLPESYIFERGDAVELATTALQQIQLAYPGAEPVSVGGRVYGYRDGVYIAIDEGAIGRLIGSFAGKPVGDPYDKGDGRPLNINTTAPTRAHLHELLDRPDFFADAPKGVAFDDLFVRVCDTGLVSEPLSPAHRARHKYGFAYAGPNEPPAFLRFLEQVLRDDADGAEKILTLQEFLGAAVCGIATQYQRALSLIGRKNNGKSRLREVFEACMPPGATTTLLPSLFSDQYSRSLLDGVRLNAVDDIPTDPISGHLKALVIGAPQQARNPGARAYTFVPQAAHLVGWNEYPRLTDTSDGFFRRWLLITIARQFNDGDPDRDPHVLTNQRILPDEIPAIVRWSLLGAKRLIQQREYTIPPSHEIALERWRGLTDPVPVWVERCTVADSTGTPARELHRAFSAWAEPFGVELTETAFCRKLGALNLRGTRGDCSRYKIAVRAAGKQAA